MRVRNNANNNTSLNTGRQEVGQAPRFLNIPAGSTLELEDAEWALFAPSAEGMLDNGLLEITKAPALSEVEEAERNAKALEAAEKLIADNKSKLAEADESPVKSEEAPVKPEADKAPTKTEAPAATKPAVAAKPAATKPATK